MVSVDAVVETAPSVQQLSDLLGAFEDVAGVVAVDVHKPSVSVTMTVPAGTMSEALQAGQDLAERALLAVGLHPVAVDTIEASSYLD